MKEDEEVFEPDVNEDTDNVQPLGPLITKVVVTYSETVSNGEYGNMRFETRYEAQVHDPPVRADAQLSLYGVERYRDAMLNSARAAVQAEVDDFLEAHGRAPKYWKGPRYKIIHSPQHQVVAVVPYERAVPMDYYGDSDTLGGLRYEAAMAKARMRTDYTLYDCLSGEEPPWRDDLPEDDEESPF